MDQTILEDIGLTKSEVKIYIALLELGSSSAGEILKKAGIQNSVLHFNLNSLIQKGLVTYIKKGKVRVYNSVSPKSLIDYVEDKKKHIEAILPELEAKQVTAKESEGAEVFEGWKGVTKMLYMLIEDGTPEDEYCFFAIGEEDNNKKMKQFYQTYGARRAERTGKARGIATKGTESLFTNRGDAEIRFVDFPIPQNMGIYKDRITYAVWGEHPRGFLIRSKVITDKYRELFNRVWDMAEKSK